MSACFLDTGPVVDLMRDRPAVQTVLARYEALYISAVVLGELVAGAYGHAQPEVGLARVEHWCSDLQVVRADKETAYVYGELWSGLKRQGKPIPTNDLWIAAAAIQYDLPLVARDEHFRRLPRLRLASY